MGGVAEVPGVLSVVCIVRVGQNLTEWRTPVKWEDGYERENAGIDCNRANPTGEGRYLNC